MDYNIYTGSNNRSSVYSVLNPSIPTKGVLIFAHGFKGYMDWGAWKLFMNGFCKMGYACYLFNFSHNGGTVENPIDFPDLEAFGNNTFSNEIQDLNKIVSIAHKGYPNKDIHLIGHSRGGGIAMLVGVNNPLVKSIITLASVSDLMFNLKDKDQISQWKNSGCIYIPNARTQQQMPLKFSLYQDYKDNSDQLNIEKALTNSSKPMLHIHGSIDETVRLDNAVSIANWSGGALEIINGANHTFGAAHPWKGVKMPMHLNQAATLISNWVKSK